MDTTRKRPRRRRTIILSATLATALTAGGGAAWAADRYLVEHVAIGDVSSYEAENSAVAAEQTTTNGIVEQTGYSSDQASIDVSTVTTGSGDDTVTYYVAEVDLTDATALRSAFAGDAFGTNITEKTSTIAAENNAILAVNGDYYGFRDTGIVIRNGVVYRDEGAREGLAFFLDGTVEIYDETTTTAADLQQGVWNTLSFGPALVADGNVIAGIEDVEVDTNFGNHSIQGQQPRTAVGVTGDNSLVFVVVDGRADGYSRGVTMTELAEIMTSMGAETAYNLDGGGSSTMYFNGEVINQPSNGGERGTSDILYIAGADA